MSTRGRSTCLAIGVAAGISFAAATAPAQDGGPEAASGDIVFRDGSRIVADLIHLELGVLKIRRPNGEEMDVEWPKVTSVTSPKPVVIVLRDGRRIESPLRPAAARESVLARSGEDGDELTVPLRLISEINPPEGMLKIKGNLSLAASVSDGNTRTRSLGLLGEIETRWYRNRLTVGGEYRYADDSGDLTAQNGRAQVKDDFFVFDRWYAYGLAKVEHDRFAGLKLRQVYSAGPGYQFVTAGDYPNEFLNGIRWLNSMEGHAEAGIAYFIEDFYDEGGREFLSARWAVRIDWPVLPYLTLFYRHEGYPSLEDVEDLSMILEQGLRLQVLSNLFVTFQVNWYWDNKPAEGFNRSDWLYLFGLGVSFGR